MVVNCLVQIEENVLSGISAVVEVPVFETKYLYSFNVLAVVINSRANV